MSCTRDYVRVRAHCVTVLSGTKAARGKVKPDIEHELSHTRTAINVRCILLGNDNSFFFHPLIRPFCFLLSVVLLDMNISDSVPLATQVHTHTHTRPADAGKVIVSELSVAIGRGARGEG